jgi:hypothetical protein
MRLTTEDAEKNQNVKTQKKLVFGMIRSRSERDDLCALCGEKLKKDFYNFLYNEKR